MIKKLWRVGNNKTYKKAEKIGVHHCILTLLFLIKNEYVNESVNESVNKSVENSDYNHLLVINDSIDNPVDESVNMSPKKEILKIIYI